MRKQCNAGWAWAAARGVQALERREDGGHQWVREMQRRAHKCGERTFTGCTCVCRVSVSTRIHALWSVVRGTQAGRLAVVCAGAAAVGATRLEDCQREGVPE